MSVYNVIVLVVFNVEAPSAERAEGAARAYARRATGWTILDSTYDLSTFEAAEDTVPDLKAEL